MAISFPGIDVKVAAERLAEPLGCSLERAHVDHWHCRAWCLMRNGERIGWGKNYDRASSCFEFSGKRTPEAVEVLRKLFPNHCVSRADVCADYEELGLFDRLRQLIDRSTPPGLTSGQMGRRTHNAARTASWGSRGGLCYLRLYEIGKQRNRSEFGHLDRVRLELEVRPDESTGKRRASALEPHQFWGSAPWTWRLAKILFDLDLPKVVQDPKTRSTPSEAFETMARTYRKRIEPLLKAGADLNLCFRSVYEEDDRRAAQNHEMRSSRAPKRNPRGQDGTAECGATNANRPAARAPP